MDRKAKLKNLRACTCCQTNLSLRRWIWFLQQRVCYTSWKKYACYHVIYIKFYSFTSHKSSRKESVRIIQSVSCVVSVATLKDEQVTVGLWFQRRKSLTVKNWIPQRGICFTYFLGNQWDVLRSHKLLKKLYNSSSWKYETFMLGYKNMFLQFSFSWFSFKCGLELSKVVSRLWN